MRLARMPFAPARWDDVIAHLGAQKNHLCVRTPRTPQPHACYAWVGRELAMAKDEAAVFIRIVLRLRCHEALRVRSVVNLAVIEDRFAVAEDEVHVARDVAMAEVLARGDARLAVGPTVAAAHINRVLIPQQAHIFE